MSLNSAEIELVVGELRGRLLGARLQDAVQPSYDTLVLEFYGAGLTRVLLCTAHGATRLHSLSRKSPKPPKPLRFMECMRSRIRGATLTGISQLGSDRIVRFDLDSRDGPFKLYARLWSGAANVLLVDGTGTIIETMAHRTAKGEIPGGRYSPETEIVPPRQAKRFEAREFDGTGGWSERIERHYDESEGTLSLEAIQARAQAFYGKRIASVERKLAATRSALAALSDVERFREIGDILTSLGGRAAIEGRTVIAEDFYRGGELRFELKEAPRGDPTKAVLEAARSCYERYKRSGEAKAELEAELASSTTRAERYARELRTLMDCRDPLLARSMLDRREKDRSSGVGAATERAHPGLSLEKDGWHFLIGRSAKENDELLRRHVRGNDTWFHARERSGAYVFVKCRKGKTIPLDIMLDAGNLAIYYSKSRSNGSGDVYYTQVKYLRRAKDGPKGLVIPTQEKNLRIALDDERLRGLREKIGAE
jgi:predicted ribosome quality control (RQC) complex YloA/Tae2 family protein